MEVKLPLSKIITRYDNRKLVIRNNRKDYWNRLEQSLLKEGLNTKKYSPVKAYKSFLHKDKYELMNGNHRVYILKKIHNENKEIKVKVISRTEVILFYIKVPFLLLKEFIKY